MKYQVMLDIELRERNEDEAIGMIEMALERISRNVYVISCISENEE